jgi:hypothetical protein
MVPQSPHAKPGRSTSKSVEWTGCANLQWLVIRSLTGEPESW